MRALLLLALLSSPALADGPFWPYWSDGKAELAGYDLVQPRYGEKRHGRAVLIFVTEPFSRARGVKVDHYNPNDPDHFTALKLNAVRKFQTGIYDYSVMTSVFVDPANGFAPAKVSFSSQEWCGHVFEEARFGQGAKVRIDSYFEGETTQLDVPVAGSEDALFITLRGLGAEALATEPVTATLLPSALDRRLRHQPAKPAAITVQWGAPTDVTVPAGKFAVMELLMAAGVPAGAVLTCPEYLANEHIQARGYVAPLHHERTGEQRYDGSPFVFDGERGYEHWLPSPRLGEHNSQVLRDVLAKSPTEIEELQRAGVIVDRPPA